MLIFQDGFVTHPISRAYAGKRLPHLKLRYRVGRKESWIGGSPRLNCKRVSSALEDEAPPISLSSRHVSAEDRRRRYWLAFPAVVEPVVCDEVVFAAPAFCGSATASTTSKRIAS